MAINIIAETRAEITEKLTEIMGETDSPQEKLYCKIMIEAGLEWSDILRAEIVAAGSDNPDEDYASQREALGRMMSASEAVFCGIIGQALTTMMPAESALPLAEFMGERVAETLKNQIIEMDAVTKDIIARNIETP